jgi:hypothetical protein
MASASEFRAALASGDVRLVRKAAAIAFPHLPQPATDEEAEVLMHVARTETKSLPLKLRAWSHRWLTERGHPSHLPDDLRPAAERMHPVIAEGVMVAVMVQDEEMRPFARKLEQAMSDAVADAYANGDTAPAIVRDRMQAARSRTYRELLGTTAGAR